jgi:DNA polymerase III delta subunit
VSQTATSTLRDDFLAALLAGDAARARHLVDRAVGDGLPVSVAYLRILSRRCARSARCGRPAS